MATTVQSRKQKGRILQQWVRDILLSLYEHLEQDDILSTGMGQSGEDLLLSPFARKSIPLSIECKNQEKLNIWEAYEQAKSNAKQYQPIVVFKKNHKKPLVAVDAEYFFDLLKNQKSDINPETDLQ